MYRPCAYTVLLSVENNENCYRVIPIHKQDGRICSVSLSFLKDGGAPTTCAVFCFLADAATATAGSVSPSSFSSSSSSNSLEDTGAILFW